MSIGFYCLEKYAYWPGHEIITGPNGMGYCVDGIPHYRFDKSFFISVFLIVLGITTTIYALIIAFNKHKKMNI